jgi:2'-5' RNA ligase
MSLLALCYPKLPRQDQRFIADFRDQYDLAYRDVVGPHFTMVFQVLDVPEPEFSAHLARVASGFSPIRFVCRYAMLHNDHSSDDYYVFLVPDGGFGAISLLHDRLYTGCLSSKLRLDIPYVPHIGIATLKNAQRCKELADELNDRPLAIEGQLDTISVVEYNGKAVTDLHHFQFGTHAP